MSKKLLFNNLKAKATCPCCGSVEDECVCISLEQLGATELEVDFAIAGKYANITYISSSNTYSYNSKTWQVIANGLKSSALTSFNTKMTELGRVNATNYGTDYYGRYISDSNCVIYWNRTDYGTPNITRLNQLMTLTDNQLNQLKTYGKYYVPTYNVTYNLAEQVILSNTDTFAYEGYEYTTTISVAESYKISSVTVLMNGEDITSTVYANETITIPSVTGNIEIVVVAEEMARYNIVYNLTEVTLSNTQEIIIENQSYTTTITPNENYKLTNVSVLMNNEDVTSNVYNSETNIIAIPNVIGNVEITVVAEEVTVYTITYDLTDVTLDNNVTSVIEGLGYTAIVTPTENYEVASISILMNNDDVTETVFDTTTNTINIPSVVGNVAIIIVAEEKEESLYLPTQSTLERYLAQAYYNEGLTIEGINRVNFNGWQNRIVCSGMTSQLITYMKEYLGLKGYSFTAGGSSYGYYNDILQFYVSESKEVIAFEDLVTSTISPYEETLAKGCMATGVKINSIGNENSLYNNKRYFLCETTNSQTLYMYMYEKLSWRYGYEYMLINGNLYLSDKIIIKHIDSYIAQNS